MAKKRNIEVKNARTGSAAARRASKISGVEGMKLSGRMQSTINGARRDGMATQDVISAIQRRFEKK